MAKSKKLSAFTLIEILVALTIMGVLLTFVAPYVFDRPDQARQLKVKNDFLAISTALNLYKLDTGNFPSGDVGLSALVKSPGDGAKYLPKIPVDPWGTNYAYSEVKEQNGFQIISAGADLAFSDDAESDDIKSEIFQ